MVNISLYTCGYIYKPNTHIKMQRIKSNQFKTNK